MLLAGVRAESIFCALNFLGRGVDLWDGDVLGSGQSSQTPLMVWELCTPCPVAQIQLTAASHLQRFLQENFSQEQKEFSGG